MNFLCSCALEFLVVRMDPNIYGYSRTCVQMSFLSSTFYNIGFSPEHKKNTHKFWWDNKADPKFRDKVLITEEERER